MADITGALIGGGITTAFAAIGFVYGYGRLTKSVEGLEKDIGGFRVDATNRLDSIAEDVITGRERVSRLEGMNT